MTKSSKDQGIQADLFKPLLVDIISMSHELVLLEKAIDWKRFEEVLAPAYCKDNCRPSIPAQINFNRVLAATTLCGEHC